jgi:putative phosphoesterase
MRIIVISDTHRNFANLEKIVTSHINNTDLFIHLGDGQYEVDMLLMKYPELAGHFDYVCGNCDFNCIANDFLCRSVENHRIFATHGHKFNVKYSLSTIKAAAAENSCDIILYGHSHQRFMSYKDGFYIMNPGSAAIPRDENPPSYGVIDVTDNGVLMNIANVDNL